MASTTRSPFLDLPTELHLLIFDYCVPDGIITIGSQSKLDAASTSDHSSLSTDSPHIPGLPAARVPAFRSGFHQELLQDADCGSETQTQMLPKGLDRDTTQNTQRELRPRKASPAPAAASRAIKRRRIHAPATPAAVYRDDQRSLSLPGTTLDLSQTYSAAAIKGVDSRWPGDKNPIVKPQYTVLQTHHRQKQGGPPLSQSHPEKEKSAEDAPRDASSHSWKDPPYTYLPHQALHLTCRQFNRELKDHRHAERKQPYARKVDLYLSFPDGVCVAYHRHAHLLRIARTINVTGVWDLRVMQDPQLVRPQDRTEDVNGRPPISMPPNDKVVLPSLQIDQLNALELLTGLVLGRKPIQAATTKYEAMHGRLKVVALRPDEEEPEKGVDYAPILNVRMWHPNGSQHHPYRPDPPPAIERFEKARSTFASASTVSAPAWPYHGHLYDQNAASSPSNMDTYSLLWSHTLSPVPAALQCVYGGSVKMAVARGKTGNAVSMSAKCNFANGRYLSMAWPKVSDGDEVEKEAVKKWLVPEDWNPDLINNCRGWAADREASMAD